jgi:hypothetical protein
MLKYPKKIIFLRIATTFFVVFLTLQVYGENPEKQLSREAEKLHFYTLQHNQLNDQALEKVLIDLQIMLDQKTTKKWKKILNNALWFQDLIRFFGSKHHFENCCFVEGIEQINKHLKDNETDYLRLQKSILIKEQIHLKEKIIFRTGRILHSAQDFFSHTNFVEIMQEKSTTIEEVLIPDFLIEEGQNQILNLIKNGLVSERFFLSFPHKCTFKVQNLTSIGKDNPYKKAGKNLTIWINPQTNQNLNGFEAAMFFAERSSYQILFQTFSKYKILTDSKVLND